MSNYWVMYECIMGKEVMHVVSEFVDEHDLKRWYKNKLENTFFDDIKLIAVTKL